jgi:hypothetical protein
MSGGAERPVEEPGLFPSGKERVPPPAGVYAAGGALLGVVLLALIVEFFLAAHRASDASQIVVGALIVADVFAGARLLSGAERRRRRVYEWRSDALELLARYTESVETVGGKLSVSGSPGPGGYEADSQPRWAAVAVRDQILLAEAALRDAGAYADASVVGEARRLAGLITDVGSLDDAGGDPPAGGATPERESRHGADAGP